MALIRFGLMRDLRKIWQDFSRAMRRSTGARAWASAWLTVRWVGGEFAARRAFEAGGHPGACTLVVAIGEDGDALAFADPDDQTGAGRGEVVDAARQRGRDPQHPAGGVVTAWTFTPRRRCLAE
jgi:hypothetical protein